MKVTLNKIKICALALGLFVGVAVPFSVTAYAEGDPEDALYEEYPDEGDYGDASSDGDEAADDAGEDSGQETSPEVLQVVSDSDYIRAYIKGLENTEISEYQIGNIPVTNVSVYPIKDDTKPFRTLIMVDNSISIPVASRELISDAIKSITENGAENETFRISTFSEDTTYLSDKYTDDVTALGNMLDSIVYENQETYLTDVLYDVVSDIALEDGYTRIIIFSDGVDNKPIGVTREELNDELKTRLIPVYTIGVNTGSNGDNLEGMFALSRITGCEYCVLEDTETQAITDMISDAANISVFRAEVPEEAKNGSRTNTKLTLSDGRELVFEAELPFSVRDTEEPNVEPTPEPEPEPEPQPLPEPTFGERAVQWIITHKPLAAVILLVFLMAITAIITLIVRKLRSRGSEETVDDYARTTELGYGKTEILGESEPYGETTRLTPDEKPGSSVKRIKLVTASDNSRFFRCEIEKEIKIGRMPDNDIVISDDTSVHGHHCIIECKDGAFYVTDLMNVKNHSSVNGIEIKPGFPQLIVTNSKLTIGRYIYVVTIMED